MENGEIAQQLAALQAVSQRAQQLRSSGGEEAAAQLEESLSYIRDTLCELRAGGARVPRGRGRVYLPDPLLYEPLRFRPSVYGS